jgi:BNR/Asp-box repeat protein
MRSLLRFRRASCMTTASHARPSRKPAQLHLEPLEDRCLLSLAPGPLALISSPDVLAGFPTNGVLSADAAVEPYVAVNPANPKNNVAGWIDHNFAGTVAGVTLDGGQTWKNVAVTGYVPGYGADPWLSFAPNGDLYFMSVTAAGHMVNKSSDGGLTWSSPIQIDGQDNGSAVDKASITADPMKPNYVYATWVRFNKSFNGNGSETMFARSTDGGQTWQPDQSIHSAKGSDFDWGNQIVVLPDGTLIDAFTEGQFTNNHQVAMTMLRSADHGQTWSAPMTAPVQQPLVDANNNPPIAIVTDPDTGKLVNAVPMFDSIAVDPHSGNLYAVWIDGRFSNFQHNSIALSMSTDGGLTWSDPIQVNQTPAKVPTLDQQAFNPTVAVAADGTVAVTYYDFRNNTSAPGALTDYWLDYWHPSATAAATNPANWSEVRLTDTSFDVEQAPTRGFLAGGYSLGDYEGLAAVGNDFVAVWGMPQNTGTANESIFFRRAIDHPSSAIAATSTSASAALVTSPDGALASGLLNMILQAMPADPRLGSATPPVPQPRQTAVPPTAAGVVTATVPSAPIRAATIEQVFAKFGSQFPDFFDMDLGVLP